MATGLVNIIADFGTSLAASVAIGATTATLTTATDDGGVALPTGTYGFTIDRKNSSKEYIECTLTGTSLTAVKTIAIGTGIATSGFAKAHRKGAEVIISDFVAIKRQQDILESGYAGATTPTTNYQLATKKYVDDLALGGATTVDRLTVTGIAGESVAAGNLVYLKAADGYWWKCDADTAATVIDVQLGIAQGSGTATNVITSGVLIRGIDTNQSGGVTGTIGYASNTAGGIASSAGTTSKILGQYQSATTFLFNPEYYTSPNVPTAGEKAGLAAGGDFGTVSASNKYITEDFLTTRAPQIVTFTGSGTWTKDAGLKYVVVELVGGGAGGSSAGNQGSRGGGAGGYSRKLIAASSLGATETVTIGAAGVGGINGVDVGNGGSGGGDGTTTSFGAHFSATGGEGGNSDTGGTGGIGVGGDINVRGGAGAYNGAGATGSGSNNAIGGGNGGDSVLGGGGAGQAPEGAPGDGGLYGGGGAGAADNGSGNTSGGAGAAGIVIVTEHYA